ncbi:S8 family peptidase [Nitrosovibrio sp. Nv6]|uniref:S8 family peptidase n=1 Tax=Nitrosovibrio sp. Nv6 TaxID=1855340 RepID=UPI0008C87103|nr:S8 family peptidase [Nitrosovibrio sp. Nv6]SEP02292.1 Subtilase family protein [Nitrosovibrio sp. Nv6]
MSSTSRPPEEQARVKPFDPVVLDRSVIAIPLLREMEEELRRIKAFEDEHPFDPEFNAVIEYNREYPGKPEEIRELVVEMAERAKTRAVEASKKRLEEILPEGNQVPDDSTQDRDAIYGNVAVMEQRRHSALKEAIHTQKIGPILGDGSYSFANLHASVIRRLLAANDRLSASGEARVKPIIKIHPARYDVIIDLNLEYPGGREAARRWVFRNVEKAKENVRVRDAGQDVHLRKDQRESSYIFARLEARVIQALVDLDIDAAKSEAKARNRGESLDNSTGAPKVNPSKFRAIFRIWPDFEISAYINKSIATVKADAAQNSFSAHGAGITWAVMDSGIKHDHEHFRKYNNVDPDSKWHKDFTIDGAGAFDDENGHGTHVAGIIAGEWSVPIDAPAAPNASFYASRPAVRVPVAVSRYVKKDSEDIEYQPIKLVEGMSGMAPRCKLVSLRVLDENGKGSVSNLIAAIGHVQEINGYGRRLLIHGVNISLGYSFEPEWFACGQSPLCVEVDRLVKTGVVVVVAAGNTGYGTLKSTNGATAAGMALTINDPGNSDLAITVGSTHRDMPHIYGVSYFSSKGPTGDGRLKPDLVAPGEKILSCAAGHLKSEGARGMECDYVETSGTSMAAPHVSGVIAAFLSVRTEFIGKAERVKDIFLASATDLRRDRYFQGEGLVDLMRAIQSV